jgi:hypothetical protein
MRIGANFAAYEFDSTRYGIDTSLEYMGAALKGEYGGQQHRGAGGVDDKGRSGQATYRVLPWVQLVFKRQVQLITQAQVKF